MYPQRKKSNGVKVGEQEASTSNPSVAKSFIQTLTNISTVCWGAIILELHFTTDFQRHHFQQLGKISWRNVR
jgi:preprotein translocase subunit SecG